ncbi:MAG TPA: hypothetical protein VMT00_08270 [Thermoanaerobaculia bacterium]|nr:hypothetical protein [Thermoanaerobaculia bacterium]
MKLLLPTTFVAVLLFIPLSPAVSQERRPLFPAPVKTLVLLNGQRFAVEGEVVVDRGRVIFSSGERLFSISLSDLDLDRTAQENGILRQTPDPAPVQPLEDPPVAEPKAKSRSAETALQTISTIGVTGREGERRTPRERTNPKIEDRWSFFAGLSSAAESNINSEPEPTADYGVIPSAGVNYRNRGTRGTLEASYAAAMHSYMETDSWDRVSHLLELSYEPRWRGRWRSETIAEVSIKGSDEDRDLSDRYILIQRFKFRLTDAAQLRFNTAYRRKLYEDDPGADAHNPYAGVDYRHSFASGLQWNLGYRWEENRAETERRRYERSTVSTELTVPLSSKSFLRAGVRYRDQLYPERIVRDLDTKPFRRDQRWLGSLSLSRNMRDNVALAVDYSYEQRLSNEEDKGFDGHGLSFSIIRYW